MIRINLGIPKWAIRVRHNRAAGMVISLIGIGLAVVIYWGLIIVAMAATGRL